MKEQVARFLLSIGAVFLRPDEPFIWASGIKSPVYCDNRLILSSPEGRLFIEEAIANLISEEFPECEAVIGTSTAGIPHAAIVASIMSLPMGYVRAKNKDHGRENRIEGRVREKEKVVVIEDLISTAGSVIDTVNALREAKAEVLCIISIFTYGMKKAGDRLKEANVRNISLTDFDTVIHEAMKEGYIKKEDVKKLFAFRDNPEDESWIGGEK